MPKKKRTLGFSVERHTSEANQLRRQAGDRVRLVTSMATAGQCASAFVAYRLLVMDWGRYVAHLEGAQKRLVPSVPSRDVDRFVRAGDVFEARCVVPPRGRR